MDSTAFGGGAGGPVYLNQILKSSTNPVTVDGNPPNPQDAGYVGSCQILMEAFSVSTGAPAKFASTTYNQFASDQSGILSNIAVLNWTSGQGSGGNGNTMDDVILGFPSGSPSVDIQLFDDKANIETQNNSWSLRDGDSQYNVIVWVC